MKRLLFGLLLVALGALTFQATKVETAYCASCYSGNCYSSNMCFSGCVCIKPGGSFSGYCAKID